MEFAAAPGAPLAALDLGSNSFRLEIAQVAQGHYRRLEYLKETVRLGGALDAEGRLHGAAVDRAMDCLRRFAARLADFKPTQVRAVATQTLREATNREAFLAQAQATLGFPVEVISGREEARLIYSGVAHLQPSNVPRLVVDIGGRSTEMILGRGHVARRAESFGVGCVGLSMRYFPDGRITAEAMRAAQVAAGAEFEEALLPFARGRWRQALGSSGTAGAVSRVLAASGISDGRITPAGLRWCMRHFLQAGHVEAVQLPALPPDRRSVLPGGLAILYTLATHFGIEEMQPALGALRQGVLFDLFERREAWRRADATDPRDAAVARLQRRLHVDLQQAERVERAALAHFDALAPDADAEDRRELRWACMLHECGFAVSAHNHHRHSAYLVTHADVPGLSQSAQHRIARLVLGQRGRLRKVAPALASESFAAQLISLRLAVIQCHARGEAAAPAWRLRRRGARVGLRWLSGEPADHPRALHLLREEAGHWDTTTELPLLLEDPPGEPAVRRATAGATG